MDEIAAPVWVVIANWNRPQDTIECMRSVLASNAVRVRVSIVDNGSSDDSIQQITHACLDTTLLPLPENLGFAGGYNAGIKQALEAGAENILVLNNDTMVEPNSISALLGSSWDVAVPKILFHGQPTRIWAAGARWRRVPPSIVMRGYGIIGQGGAEGTAWNQPRALDYATGCALLVRRHVFEMVGGFDTIFESYMEDYDFCFRVRAAGLSIGYVPAARIYHKVARTLGLKSPRWWQLMGRNTVLFYRKDNRFPGWMLWSFLAWMFPREIVKGNAARLPDFWRGAREGIELLKRKETNAGTRRL